MKKTFIFLLILSLSLSGTISNKLETTFKHIIDDLRKLDATNHPIIFSSPVSYNICSISWTCNTSSKILEELNVALHKVNTDKLSHSINTTLGIIKGNLKAIKNFCQQGQILMGEKPCQSRQCDRHHLECFIRILQCLYRNCTATPMQSFSKKECESLNRL